MKLHVYKYYRAVHKDDSRILTEGLNTFSNTVLTVKNCPEGCRDLFLERLVWDVLVRELDVLHRLLCVIIRQTDMSSESQHRPSGKQKDVEKDRM